MIVSFGLIGLIIFLIVFLSTWKNRKENKKQQVEAFNVIGTLNQLISNSQKHRGLSASFLQGNEEVKPAIITLRNDINQLKSSLSEVKSLNTNQRWNAYIDHWQRLENNAFSLKVVDSFKQHTALIENLLYLFEDITEAWQQNRLLPMSFNHFKFLWRELPMAVEFIGQARAVGMAVSTSGVSSQIDKVKLGYLHAKIGQLSSQALYQLAQCSGNLVSNEISQAQVFCDELIHTIQQEFIAKDKVTLNSDAYFVQASKAMEQLNTLLDSTIQRLTLSVA